MNQLVKPLGSGSPGLVLLALLRGPLGEGLGGAHVGAQAAGAAQAPVNLHLRLIAGEIQGTGLIAAAQPG